LPLLAAVEDGVLYAMVTPGRVVALAERREANGR
jgi:hypothetical protein